jgi:putative addiction module component (TIGR02574 family)
MTAITERILHEALSLSQEERAMLADRLTDSLEHPPADELRVEELEATLRQRMEELDSGNVVPIPWSHVRREVLGLES